MKRLATDEQPLQVPLFLIDIWVRASNVLVGFMSERVAKEIKNYIGTFQQSDENNFTGVWRSYLRIRVTLDVRKPLKRRMKIKKAGGSWIWINFQYERIRHLCFVCGMLDHTESYC